MLWDLVYDFYVIYIFGGVASDNSPHNAFLGGFVDMDGAFDYSYTRQFGFSFQNVFLSGYDAIDTYGTTLYMSLGNYLSLIATIITMVAILLFCIFFIKKIIGVMFRLFTFGA